MLNIYWDFEKFFCEIEFVPYDIVRCKNIEIKDYWTVNTSQELLKSMFKQETLADCVIKVSALN